MDAVGHTRDLQTPKAPFLTISSKNLLIHMCHSLKLHPSKFFTGSANRPHLGRLRNCSPHLHVMNYQDGDQQICHLCADGHVLGDWGTEL